jgi:large subunit ribosomal protein L10
MHNPAAPVPAEADGEPARAGRAPPLLLRRRFVLSDGGAMPNAEKLEKVQALKERISDSEALLLTEYRGLTVHDTKELRRSLADTASFAVVKNTLMSRASVEAGIDDFQRLLEGPTAVAFVKGDVVSAAKKVVDAAKKYPALILKGAYMEGRVLDAAQAQALATLESRDVMLSRIAGMIKADVARAAAAFVAVQSRVLGLLEAYKNQKEE